MVANKSSRELSIEICLGTLYWVAIYEKVVNPINFGLFESLGKLTIYLFPSCLLIKNMELIKSKLSGFSYYLMFFS